MSYNSINLIGYGEDALTLWALKNKIYLILQELNDHSDISKCIAFFRPSFGRRGGDKSAQFGEFDFIILSQTHIYLGESKWDKSSETKDEILELRHEQRLRHEIMNFYIREWLKDDYSEKDWEEFLYKARDSAEQNGISKPLAPAESLLSSNLRALLQIIEDHFKPSHPKIKNVLLFLHSDTNVILPEKVSSNFELVSIDYSADSIDNFIKI